jgi:hypothetical protein
MNAQSRIDRADPNRATFLTDKDEPKFTKSSVESDEEVRAFPSMLSSPPNLAYARSESADPVCAKLNTLIVEPRRADARRLSELPREQKSMTEVRLLKSPRAATLKPEPIRE